MFWQNGLYFPKVFEVTRTKRPCSSFVLSAFFKKKKKGKVNQKQTHRLENKFMATGENDGRENRLVVETDMHTLLYLH